MTSINQAKKGITSLTQFLTRCFSLNRKACNTTISKKLLHIYEQIEENSIPIYIYFYNEDSQRFLPSSTNTRIPSTFPSKDLFKKEDPSYIFPCAVS